VTSATLVACGSEMPTPTQAPTPTPTATATPPPLPAPTPRSLAFFDALEALRRAVRASPDHLIAQAEALIAARDAEGLVRLVREAITIYPGGDSGTGDALTGWRWGTRATLRGGAGTPREVAELLAELLQRAGFQAEVVEVLQREPITAGDVLRRAVPRPFTPDLDNATLEAARRALNLPPPQPPQIADADGRDSAALADALLAALGDAPRAPATFDMADRLFYLPGVRLTRDGQAQLVNLWAREGPAFAPIERDHRLAPPRRPGLTVTVRVEAAHAYAPAERFTLVERTWNAEALVGRQVEVAFAPPSRTLDEALAASRTAVRADQLVFTPVLAVRGPDVDAEATRALSAVGDPFTLTGQVLREGDGRPTLGDRPLPPTRPPSDTPLIASADIAVGAAAFPLVTLEVMPRDAQGNPIEDLPAAHFLIEEDGRPVAALMERWARPAPRVLLLLDDSGSIPADFRGRGAQALARALAERIKAAEPRAQFRVAKIFEDTADPGRNAWTDDPGEVADQVVRASGFGSRLWESLADAARLGATAIVMITDGQANDAAGQRLSEPPPAPLAAVQAGPPAVVIGVGELDPPMLERLGQAGRLGAFPAATQEEAIRAVTQALNASPAPPYRFSYRAPEEAGGAQRTVRLFEQYGAGDKPRRALLAQATYTPPPPQARAEPPALSGLFLTVSVGNQNATRVLGGLATRRSDARPTAAHLAEVRRALRSHATLSFEAGAPPLAHQLDDVYTAMLSLRPLLEAGDRAARLNAIAAGFYLPPADLHTANVPLPGSPGEPLTFETGLRVALHRVSPTETPDGKSAATRWVDLLPLAGFRTADGDPARAFRLTAQRTARLALAESLAFPSSTVAALRGKALRPARSESDILQPLRAAGADEATLRRMSDLFAPWLAPGSRVLWSGDATLAGWALDASGAVWGILGGDGAQTAGGGSAGFSPTSILDAAMLAGDVAAFVGLGGFSFAGGVWLALAATIYKKVEAATALLAQLPVSPDDPAPDASGAAGIADPSDIGCALAQAAAFEAVSRVGGALFGELFERMVSAVSALDGARSMGAGSGFFC
jgi:hypothetical protein